MSAAVRTNVFGSSGRGGPDGLALADADADAPAAAPVPTGEASPPPLEPHPVRTATQATAAHMPAETRPAPPDTQDKSRTPSLAVSH